MKPPSRFAAVLAVAAAAFVTSLVAAQRRDAFVLSRDHPAIRYSSGEPDNPVERLNRRLAAGEARLSYDTGNGYLRSLLDALAVPVSSQALVFSKTSFQARAGQRCTTRGRSSPPTPFRSGGCAARDVLEIAAPDPARASSSTRCRKARAEARSAARARAARPNAWPVICRGTRCGVPGLMVDEHVSAAGRELVRQRLHTVHGSPLEQRWGGWWVTGDHGGARHMGNIPVMPADKGKSKRPRNPTAPLRVGRGLFDLKGYPTPTATSWR